MKKTCQDMLTTVFGWWKYGWVSLLHFCNFKVSIMNTYCVYNRNICNKGRPAKHYDKDHLRKPDKIFNQNPTSTTQLFLNWFPCFFPSSMLCILIIDTCIVTDWHAEWDINSHCWVLGIWVTFFSSTLLNFPKFGMSMYYICNGKIHT